MELLGHFLKGSLHRSGQVRLPGSFTKSLFTLKDMILHHEDILAQDQRVDQLLC